MTDARSLPENDLPGLEIAIIGLAARVPGAPDIDTFWANLKAGKESIQSLDIDVLRARGVSDALLSAPDFVPRGADIDGADTFDAAFFGYAPSEAEILDPQHRIFLECAWHAMENAGYVAGADTGAVGIYASAGMNGYLLNLYGNAALRDTVSPYEVFTANDKDFLATRTAYKLDLRGPAVTVQTACSSSLVAVHMAAQSLIAGECDMALAGGVAVSRQDGYRALSGSILSPTGQCRAFAADADGTVTGNGVGLVVLKRLDDALADGDRIDAVIRGSAINNDGSGKASFTAPDVAAQAEVIAAAQAAADVSPASISYVEAHGTGTSLGDPVEVTALTRAFRRGTDACGFCALGSVKPSIGHLDTAAGVIGLIKTALMLRDRTLVPSLHFEAPNPQIDFANIPFVVNTTLRPWTGNGPLRAGVSSFGIGGTNAHVVLEEAPQRATTAATDGPHLLTLSARSAEALTAAATGLADHLAKCAPALADAAMTLEKGRRAFRWRQSVVADNPEAAIRALHNLAPTHPAPADPVAPVFLFPGQGAQYAGMARGLYDAVPSFAATLDRAAAHLDQDLDALIFATGNDIHRTQTAQLALFIVEVALARVWNARGVTPRALLGHSLGEWSAACIAGVVTFEHGLDIVAARGRLMQAAAPGAMLAVVHPDTDVPAFADVEIAAVNGPGLTTLTGTLAAMRTAEVALMQAGVAVKRLDTSHGFHSAAMTPAAEAFERFLAGKSLSAPTLPVVSNVTGTWLTEAQATDPAYWARQLRGTVQFGAGVDTTRALDHPVFLEIGPGSVLSGLIRLHDDAVTVPGLTGKDDMADVLGGLGAAWAAGVPVDRAPLTKPTGQRIALPGYPFQRQRYWVTPDTVPTQTTTLAAAPAQNAAVYLPTWHRIAVPPVTGKTRRTWFILDDGHIGRALAQALERGGDDAYRVTKGAAFGEPAYRQFTLRPGHRDDLTQALRTLQDRGAMPTDVVMAWSLEDPNVGDLHSVIEALAAEGRERCLTLLTFGAADVTGAETLHPEQAQLRGMLDVAGQEYPWLGCRVIDLDPEDTAKPRDAAAVLRDALVQRDAPVTARRSGRFWGLSHRAQPLPTSRNALRKNGVYAVIGHVTQGIGQVWADRIATMARLAVIEPADATPLDRNAADNLLRINADCADPIALGAALDQVTARWGRLDGVFLSTPFSDAESTAPLSLTGPTQLARVRETCIAPVEALAEVSATRRIGFICLQSSLASVIGGVGLASYASGHHHTDAFAVKADRQSQTDWIAIGWDMLSTGPDDGDSDGGGSDHALSADQVWDLTERILGAGMTGACVVSRSDVDARRTLWLNPRPKVDTPDAATTARARPDIDTLFVAPQSGTETQVSEILRDLLGLDRIGVNDGFFELGGHSLLAIRAIAKLREAFPVDIDMRELLVDNPSAKSIAALIEAKLNGDADLAALLDDLSDGSLDALLSEGTA